MPRYEEHICPTCGVAYGLTPEFVLGRRETKGTFYCPNGHSLSFKKSEADRLAEELSRTKQRLAEERDRIYELTERIERERQNHATTKKQMAAFKGKVGTLTRRISAGTCPCCHRNFGNLANHMKHKHPNFVAEAAE